MRRLWNASSPKTTSIGSFTSPVLKAVGESVAKPIEYYDNNLYSTLVLLKTMRKHGVKKIIFLLLRHRVRHAEGTADYRGRRRPAAPPTRTAPQAVPGADSARRTCGPIRPGPSCCCATSTRSAHESGLLGEDPKGIPANLTPVRGQGRGRRASKEVQVYGDDYDTPDGTGVRDYIHVVDLAKGHVAVIDHIDKEGVFVTTTWVPATATPCLRSSRLTRRPPVIRFRTRSSRVAPVTSPPATPTLPRRRRSLAGRPS